MKKLQVVIFLVIISIISLGMKLYLVNFSLFPVEDAIGYILRSISITNGDFSALSAKTLGWPIFLSPFVSFIDSENFIDYVNTARLVSLSISTGSIFMMYKIGRKFFTEKYSIVAACLFAFEPHLNYNSGQALSEPLYILIFMISFYFILSYRTRFHYLSFLFVGILWWVRWPGIVMLLVVSIIFFYYSKLEGKTFGKYFLCIGIFLLVSSPMLLNKFDTFGDPLYFDYGGKIFTGEFGTLQSVNTSNLDYTAINYIDEHGIMQFIDRFFITGIFNIVEQLTRISFPYLIFLIPFGIIFSLRAFDQTQKFVNANWILILTTLSLMVIIFAVIPERRFLFYLFPFLIIFGTIPIQRLIEYGLSTFSFTHKQKNYSLLIIILIVIILSSLFLTRYDIQDQSEQQEQIEFIKLLNDRISGKILDAGNTLKGINYLNLSEPNTKFRSIGQEGIIMSSISYNENINVINIFGSTLNDFILNSEQENLKYIAINEEGITEIWYPFLSNIYENEQNYSYLKKILDTNELGFKKFKVKVFEIDYNKFHEIRS